MYDTLKYIFIKGTNINFGVAELNIFFFFFASGLGLSPSSVFNEALWRFLLISFFYLELALPSASITNVSGSTRTCLNPYVQGSVQLFRQYLFFSVPMILIPQYIWESPS